MRLLRRSVSGHPWGLRIQKDVRPDKFGSCVGLDARALRKVRAMAFAEHAHKPGRSVGLVSQIERGLSE